ncbi:olfactory receptor 1D2-like [Aplochiton taeniatus]
MENLSIFTVFTLSGLNESVDYRVTLFSLTLLCYCVILLVNVTLIVTIISDENLHEPMYILLCNLCINGLYGTVGFYPKFLLDLISNDHVISYAGCMLQAFVIYSYAASDFSILAVMAYDRYVAICRPLEYHAVMTKQRLSLLVCCLWVVPLFFVAVAIFQTTTLNLCGIYVHKLYCDNWSVVKLSCSVATPNNIIGYVVILLYFGHVMFIVYSYISIIRSSLKSIEDRGKFMQTCGPHLLSLLNVTVAMLFDLMYTRYGSREMSQSLQNIMAIEFLVIPPIVNPLIYGLKLTKVRNGVMALWWPWQQM